MGKRNKRRWKALRREEFVPDSQQLPEQTADTSGISGAASSNRFKHPIAEENTSGGSKTVALSLTPSESARSSHHMKKKLLPWVEDDDGAVWRAVVANKLSKPPSVLPTYEAKSRVTTSVASQTSRSIWRRPNPKQASKRRGKQRCIVASEEADDKPHVIHIPRPSALGGESSKVVSEPVTRLDLDAQAYALSNALSGLRLVDGIHPYEFRTPEDTCPLTDDYSSGLGSPVYSNPSSAILSYATTHTGRSVIPSNSSPASKRAVVPPPWIPSMPTVLKRSKSMEWFMGHREKDLSEEERAERLHYRYNMA